MRINQISLSRLRTNILPEAIKRRTLVKTGLLLFIIVFFSIAFEHAEQMNSSDLAAHAAFATDIQATGQIDGTLPHFLYHLLFIGFDEIVPGDTLVLSTIFPMVLTTMLTGLLLFELFRRDLPDTMPLFVVTGLSISLLIISPILFAAEPPYLIGYIHPTVYHNPTQNILRLFVLPVFLFAMRVLNPQAYESRNQQVFLVSLAFTVTLLMGVSKPSYSICLVPAMGLAVLYRLVKRQPIDWTLLIIGLALPIGLLLGLQFLVTYTDPTGDSVALGFFRFYEILKIPVPVVLFRFLLSFVFPIAVYALYFRKARQSTALNFAWLTAFIGVFYALFVHETGGRIHHGNFVWGAYAALFVLMFVSVRFLLKEHRPFVQALAESPLRAIRHAMPVRLRIVAFLFVLHVLSGLRYYVVFLGAE